MVLFINGCVRTESRTLMLAKEVLARIPDEVCEVCLYPDGPEGLDAQSLSRREQLLAAHAYDDPMFRYARQFAQADTVVLAAPYWDLLFPAKVRAYLEAVTVSGITFFYNAQGIPQGLCRAKQFIYVTTAGGPIFRHFGYEYTEALGKTFFGIPAFLLIRAEGLDIDGADPTAILNAAVSALPARI